LLIGVFFYNRSESEIAHLDQKELSDMSEYKDLSNLNLISGAFRDAPSASILAKDKLTENVLFRLALPSGITTETFFDIQIRDEQKPIATFKACAPVQQSKRTRDSAGCSFVRIKKRKLQN
jgi:hypothetical protein